MTLRVVGQVAVSGGSFVLSLNTVLIVMTVLEFIFELDGSTAWVTIKILAVRIPLHVSVRHRSKPDSVSYLAGSALKEGILRHHRALFHFGFKLGH